MMMVECASNLEETITKQIVESMIDYLIIVDRSMEECYDMFVIKGILQNEGVDLD